MKQDEKQQKVKEMQKELDNKKMNNNTVNNTFSSNNNKNWKNYNKIINKTEDIINLKHCSIQNKISSIDIKKILKEDKNVNKIRSDLVVGEEKMKILDENKDNIKIHEIKMVNMSMNPQSNKEASNSPKNSIKKFNANVNNIEEDRKDFDAICKTLVEYLGNLYERYIQENKFNKYGRTKILLPVPRLIMFYNGTSDFPEEEVLKLSDAFPEGSASDIDVRVRMLNINAGKNTHLKDACAPLAAYSWIVESIRTKREYTDLSDAIDSSIREMPDSFVIKPFLTAHLAEVKGMLETEYDEQKAMELFRIEGWTEGHAAGREEGIEVGIGKGREETTRSFVANLLKMGMTPEFIAEATGLPLDAVDRMKEDSSLRSE